MKVLGVIVEYNPQHNGHIYHLTESKKKVDPDVVIAVMSGHFTQRGEPACTTKWNRAKLAIASGIDLVVELPYAYSNQAANLFALGATSILNHLAVTHLVFGSELGDIKALIRLAKIMDNADFQESVKKELVTGISLPAAYARVNPSFKGANNTLGIQYIRAIQKSSASIDPITIKRYGSDHNSQLPTDDNIASATAIRRMIAKGVDYSSFVPMPIEDVYMKLQTWEQHYKFLRYKLLTTAPVELEKIHDMVEGIENRLVAAAMRCSNFTEFIEAVGTKRYTNTRIQRICTNILTGLSKKDITDWDLHAGAPYVRILGLNEKGATYLRRIKKDVQVPIYSTFGKDVHPMLKHEQKVTAAYVSVYEGEHASKVIKKEYAGRPLSS